MNDKEVRGQLKELGILISVVDLKEEDGDGNGVFRVDLQTDKVYYFVIHSPVKPNLVEALQNLALLYKESKGTFAQWLYIHGAEPKDRKEAQVFFSIYRDTKKTGQRALDILGEDMLERMLIEA